MSKIGKLRCECVTDLAQFDQSAAKPDILLNQGVIAGNVVCDLIGQGRKVNADLRGRLGDSSLEIPLDRS